MKTLVLVIGVTLFSFMANASGNSNKWSANKGEKYFHTYASLAFMSPASKALHLTEAEMEISAEESLEVESWMINESIFSSPLPVEETEETMEVDSWMLTQENFVDTFSTKESEKALEVESWMLDESTWEN